MALLIKNINVGNTDISDISDGTLTGAIQEINNLNSDAIKFGIQNGEYGYYNNNNTFIVFKRPTGTAEAIHVLSGYTFSNASSTSIEGAMPYNDPISTTINAGATYAIPQGYHTGYGNVVANSLANQTTVDSGKTAAAAAQILTGYQAWVNGSKISGSMANRGAANSTINACTTYAIQAGYWSAGTCTGQQLDGDATEANVLTGKTFYNNSSVKKTGTMANKGTLKTTANAMSTVAIPAGYYSASTVVGQTLSGDAVASQVYYGKTFYNNTSAKVTGSMATNGTLTSTHSSTVAGAASTYTVRPSAAGFYTTAKTATLVATQSGTIAPAGGTGTVSVNIKPGYYNKIVVNRTNAYNAGTAAGAASASVTFTKIGTYGSTNTNRPSAASSASTFSAASITGYQNLTSANFFFTVTKVTYNHGTFGAAGTNSFTPSITYTASSGLGTLSNITKRVGSNTEKFDCALYGDLYCVH